MMRFTLWQPGSVSSSKNPVACTRAAANWPGHAAVCRARVGGAQGGGAKSKGKKGTGAAKKSGKSAKPASAAEKQQAMLQSLSGAVPAPAAPELAAEAATGTPEGSEASAGVTLVKRKGAVAAARECTRIEGAIYDHPMYYDWAFGYRDYEVEVDFLFDVFEQITGDEPTSFVELGCGPAQHALEMAESGVEACGVDSSAAMLEYAASLAAEDDLKVALLQQDIRSLALPDDKKVDIAACLFGTFQHMLTMDDAMRCMKGVSHALKPGGLFIIELPHPALLFDGSITSSADFWDIQISEAQVEVLWGQEGDAFNPMTQVLSRNVLINIMMRGGELLELTEVVDMRQYTYQELSLLASTAGLRIRAAYGDFDMGAPLALDGSGGGRVLEDDDDDDDEGYKPSGDDEEDERPHRLILVLQKPLDADDIDMAGAALN